MTGSLVSAADAGEPACQLCWLVQVPWLIIGPLQGAIVLCAPLLLPITISTVAQAVAVSPSGHNLLVLRLLLVGLG